MWERHLILWLYSTTSLVLELSKVLQNLLSVLWGLLIVVYITTRPDVLRSTPSFQPAPELNYYGMHGAFQITTENFRKA